MKSANTSTSKSTRNTAARIHTAASTHTRTYININGKPFAVVAIICYFGFWFLSIVLSFIQLQQLQDEGRRESLNGFLYLFGNYNRNMTLRFSVIMWPFIVVVIDVVIQPLMVKIKTLLTSAIISTTTTIMAVTTFDVRSGIGFRDDESHIFFIWLYFSVKESFLNC